MSGNEYHAPEKERVKLSENKISFWDQFSPKKDILG